MLRKLSNIEFNSIDPNPKYADYSIIANNASWVLPQLMAFLGTSLPLRKNEAGLFSFKETLSATREALNANALVLDNSVILNTADFLGILSVLRAKPRSEILGAIKQSNSNGLRYCGPVPLFCSAFKEYRDIPYSSWDWSEEEKKYFIDEDILEYSTSFGQSYDYSEEELLDFRESALLIKSGTKAGTKRDPKRTTSVYGVSHESFNSLPRFTKLALTQLWVFSPSLVNKYIISNLEDIDSFAKPLITSDVLVPETSLPDLPWN